MNTLSVIESTNLEEFINKKPLDIYESYEMFCDEFDLIPLTSKELKKAILSIHGLEVRPAQVDGKVSRVYYSKHYRKYSEYNPIVEVVESLEGELWTDVKGYDGIYKVSTHGRLKRILNSGERLQGGRINNSGYMIYTLSNGDNTICTSSQQIVAQAFINNPFDLPEVDHFDGDILNNHVNNLRWVSSKENKEHSRELNRLINDEVTHINAWLGDDILEPTITVTVNQTIRYEEPTLM